MSRQPFLFSAAVQSGAGFALIEILICILVLAVGLIGAAMMQLHATRTTEESNVHDTAVTLAAQIADELRANDVEMRLPDNQNPFLSFRYTFGGPHPDAPDCYRQACMPDQLANASMRNWQLWADQVLHAGGRIEICRQPPAAAGTSLTWCTDSSGASPSAPVAVRIGWAERDAAGRAVTDSSPRIAVLVSPYSQ